MRTVVKKVSYWRSREVKIFYVHKLGPKYIFIIFYSSVFL
jgi:hypothetical protein